MEISKISCPHVVRPHVRQALLLCALLLSACQAEDTVDAASRQPSTTSATEPLDVPADPQPQRTRELAEDTPALQSFFNPERSKDDG